MENKKQFRGRNCFLTLGSGKTAAMKGILNCMEAARLPMSGIYIVSPMILSNL